MINTFGTATFDSICPTIYSIKDLANLSPVSFYIAKDPEFICIKHGDQLTISYQPYDATRVLREKEQAILALNTGDDMVLVDFFEEPKVIYNVTTRKITTAVYNFPMQPLKGPYPILFDLKGNPFKTTIMNINVAYLLSESLWYIGDPKSKVNGTQLGKAMFLEMYSRLGYTVDSAKIGDLQLWLSAESTSVLSSGNTSNFQNGVRKTLEKRKKSKLLREKEKEENKEPEKKEDIRTESEFYLSKIVSEGVPSVKTTQDIVIDLQDFSDFGVTEAKIVPGKQLLFYIKYKEERPIERNEFVEMLGHENFSFILIGK